MRGESRFVGGGRFSVTSLICQRRRRGGRRKGLLPCQVLFGLCLPPLRQPRRKPQPPQPQPRRIDRFPPPRPPPTPKCLILLPAPPAIPFHRGKRPLPPPPPPVSDTNFLSTQRRGKSLRSFLLLFFVNFLLSRLRQIPLEGIFGPRKQRRRMPSFLPLPFPL